MILVRLQYRGGREPAVALRASIRTKLGHVEAVLPAESVTLDQTSGRLTIDGAGLPAGPVELRVSLINKQGIESDASALTFENPGAAHTDGPQVASVRPERPALVRSRGSDRINAWFRISASSSSWMWCRWAVR